MTHKSYTVLVMIIKKNHISHNVYNYKSH